jgi:Tol biopolymer transport system component
MMQALLSFALVALSAQGMFMFHSPRWSPDGGWLVLTTDIDGDEEIWVVSREGKQHRKLTHNSVSDTGADWAQDGRTIVFQRHGGERVEHLEMNADGSNVQQYRARPRVVAGLVVEEQRTSDGQAVVLKRSSGAGRRISQVRWAEQPSLSPDGRFVVFEGRDRPDDVLSSHIAIWDSRSERIRVIARGTDPSWSPDGRMLLFKTPRELDNALFIAVVEVAGGQVRLLAPGVHPHFSPDGRSVAFMTDRQDRADVHVIGTDGTNEQCLTCTWPE